MSPTTPTTVRSASAELEAAARSGSRPGQCRFANDSLTTATKGASRVSESRMSRPAFRGMPSVEKKPGVAKRRVAMGCAPGACASPGRITGQTPPRITIGR